MAMAQPGWAANPPRLASDDPGHTIRRRGEPVVRASVRRLIVTTVAGQGVGAVRQTVVLGLCAAVGLCLTGCVSPTAEVTVTGSDVAKIDVTSTAFAHEGEIPSRYTCDGGDVSPPLAWTPGPAPTRSYALIMDDPDAPSGTWVHWVAWNIAGTTLEEAAKGAAGEPSQGTNSGKRTGYSGPCPPSSTGAHRYYFKMYALDTTLDLPTGTTKDALMQAMAGHVLTQGALMGWYKRQ
jgi:Raf kinase inhibitor-like YbhB/YbcL family protein